jgi:hypothetical protein
MELSGRLALLVFAAFLAGVIGYSAARAAGGADDPAVIASNPAAFERLRTDLARRTQAKEDARRPVQVSKKHVAESGCLIKPVMSDREIDACRRPVGPRAAQ